MIRRLLLLASLLWAPILAIAQSSLPNPIPVPAKIVDSMNKVRKFEGN